jgi:hypothetical protein
MTGQTYGISSPHASGSRGEGCNNEGRIQSALDSGNPLVYVPYGVYRINKGLLVSSNTRLVVHPEARIILAEGAGRQATDFLLSNRNPGTGDTNISISGGIWDGNNRHNPRGREGDGDAYTGTLINMKNVTGLELLDMRLKDSTAYFTRLTRVSRFRIERIEFQITHLTRNQDGIHCAGHCTDGDIHHISAHGTTTTGDDLVALNADDALLRSELLGAEAGPISNLRISDLSADDCHSFVRMASIWAEISNIDIRNVRGGCRNMALNADALRYCRVPLFNSKDAAYAHGVGMLRNIRFANACVHMTGDGNKAIFCLESRMDNFRLADIRRNLPHDTCPAAPLLGIRNVKQQELQAEYRSSRPASPALLRSWATVAGRDGYVRQEACGCIHEFEITDSDHIAELVAGKPEVHPLPPPNNMVGLSA